MSTSKKQLLRKYRDRVVSIWNEGEDGWWAELQQGWEWCANTEEHCAHEDTLKELDKALSFACYCSCKECTDWRKEAGFKLVPIGKGIYKEVKEGAL